MLAVRDHIVIVLIGLMVFYECKRMSCDVLLCDCLNRHDVVFLLNDFCHVTIMGL